MPPSEYKATRIDVQIVGWTGEAGSEREASARIAELRNRGYQFVPNAVGSAHNNYYARSWVMLEGEVEIDEPA
jgi:hypothetical protein